MDKESIRGSSFDCCGNCQYMKTMDAFGWGRCVAHQAETHCGRKCSRHLEQMTYYEYIDSQEWKSIRAAHIFQYPKCERCGSENNLQVHHLYYKNNLGFLVFGRETSDGLATLCSDCHQELHEELEAAKFQIGTVEHQLLIELEVLSTKYSDIISDITSSCIAKFFGKHKVKRYPHIAAVINAELTPNIRFSLNTSSYLKKAAALRKQSK